MKKVRRKGSEIVKLRDEDRERKGEKPKEEEEGKRVRSLIQFGR